MIESGYTMLLTDVEEKTRIKSSMISFKKICCHKGSMNFIFPLQGKYSLYTVKMI